MRRGLYLVLLMLCLAVVAADSQVVISPLNTHIAPGEWAEYQLTITNNLDQTQRYSLYSLQSGQGWNVDPDPLKDKIMEIAPGKSKTTKIRVTPLEEFKSGLYEVALSVDSDYGELYSPSLKVFIGEVGHSSYLPTISEEIDMNEKMVPGEPNSVKLFLTNRNPLDMKNLVIRMESELEGFTKEVAIDLGPLQKKTVEFTALTSKFQQPKDYVVFFIYEYNGQQVKVIPRKVEVLTETPAFVQKADWTSIYMKHFVDLTVTNTGNVKNTQNVRYPVSFWQGMFAFGGEVVTEDSGRYIQWETTLGPDESVTIPFIINYRAFVYILLFLLAFAIFYYAVRSPVVVRKKAVTTKFAESGALSELKVTLEIMNKSGKVLKGVEVTDFVPAIANVEKSLELGTLKPKEIRHLKKGTKVIWALAELDSQEHRLITYKLRAKLNILGTFSLSRAIVEYKKGKRKAKAYSNMFRLKT